MHSLVPTSQASTRTLANVTRVRRHSSQLKVNTIGRNCSFPDTIEEVQNQSEIATTHRPPAKPESPFLRFEAERRGGRSKRSENWVRSRSIVLRNQCRDHSSEPRLKKVDGRSTPSLASKTRRTSCPKEEGINAGEEGKGEGEGEGEGLGQGRPRQRVRK